MKASIQSHMWGYEVHQGGQTVTLWRPMEGMDFGSNQGLLKCFVSWRNDSEAALIGEILVFISRADTTLYIPRVIDGAGYALRNQTIAMMFQMDLRMIPLEQQGDWVLTSELYDEGIHNKIDTQTISFIVGHAPPPPVTTHRWTFPTEGYLPQHLPDQFVGNVALAPLTPPPQIQGVYHYDSDLNTWLFWAKGAPNNTLHILQGGLVADYMVTATGACQWEIPLSVGYE